MGNIPDFVLPLDAGNYTNCNIAQEIVMQMKGFIRLVVLQYVRKEDIPI